MLPPGTGATSAPLARVGDNSSGSAGGELRRIAPRSPRAALEPERVTIPTRWSKGARHPVVIAGNAVFTVLILIALIGGIVFAVAKQRFDAPGPLRRG